MTTEETGASPTFAIVPIPTSLATDPRYSRHTQAVITQRYRALRLHALKTAPAAFASSYELEVKRGLDQTLDRLSNPKAINFIALKANSESKDTTTSDDGLPELLMPEWMAEWVGMIVLLGPQSDDTSSGPSARRDPFAKMTGPIEALEDQDTVDSHSRPRYALRYHLNGVFVNPSARKSGLGQRLVSAALEKAAAAAREAQVPMKCSVLVDSENDVARRVYEAAGFRVVAREAYVQQPRELVAGESQASERVALLMKVELGSPGDR
ncbi:hypothetical protein B0A50_05817 [Salinomyces thailandicus]|uniref:N-acetyltransferase domain-containing protein n=1 Tax=Salinomyces thailandicus TaxID=706561 RepID=A0A4U0TUS0_9PEZI|nr:hypothetical protein B0A50_05817 [Salinomyces thailandica]